MNTALHLATAARMAAAALLAATLAACMSNHREIAGTTGCAQSAAQAHAPRTSADIGPPYFGVEYEQEQRALAARAIEAQPQPF